MNHRSHLALTLGLLVLLASFAPVFPTQAMTFTVPASYGITCSGISQSNPSANITWDRDTTGAGTETLRYRVTDGAGTTLFAYDDTRSVGSSANTIAFGYSATPSYNPIRFLLTSPAGNGFGEQVLVDISGDCAGLPSVTVPSVNFAGPGIPSGFVLRTITCDVAVFGQPAGTPVGSNRIKAGQTWYVNPKSVTGSDGEQWTEIFTSSSPNGYIPTKCVGG